MNRFEDLRTFVTVVESGSFTAAGERLGAAKSAVSRRVAGLEERLGVQLLRRTTRQMNLTDTGSRFYEQATRILADLDEVEASVLQQHGELRGILRVALPLAFGVRHMGAVIDEFSRLHPNVSFDLDLNDRRIDLIEQGIDLAVRIGRLDDSSLVARHLFDAHTVVCGSPQYFAKHGTPQTPDELRHHRCLVYGNLADPTKWVCRDAAGKTVRVDVPAAMRATSGEFLNVAAMKGLGIAVQPTFIAGEAIAGGTLVPILSDYHWPLTPAYAVYPATRHLSYRVRAFIDFLVQHFAGAPAWDRDCGGRSAAANARPE